MAEQSSKQPQFDAVLTSAQRLALPLSAPAVRVGYTVFESDTGGAYIVGVQAGSTQAAPTLVWVPLAAGVASDNLNVYLDAVSGNDANNGLSPSTAWQTMVPLFRDRPAFNRRQNRVNFAAGNYTWPADPANSFQGATYTPSTQLGDLAEPETWVGVMQTVTTLTAVGGTGSDQFVTGGGLTVNAYRGMRLQLTSGAKSGFQVLIRSNTTTTLVLASSLGTVAVGVTAAVMTAGPVKIAIPIGATVRGSAATRLDTIGIEWDVTGVSFAGVTGLFVQGCQMTLDRAKLVLNTCGMVESTRGGVVSFFGAQAPDLAPAVNFGGVYATNTTGNGGCIAASGKDSVVRGAVVCDKTMLAGDAGGLLDLGTIDLSNSAIFCGPQALLNVNTGTNTPSLITKLVNGVTLAYPNETLTYAATPPFKAAVNVVDGTAVANFVFVDVADNAHDGITLNLYSSIALFGVTSSVINAGFGVSIQGASQCYFSDPVIGFPACTINGTGGQVSLGGPTYGAVQTFAAAVATGVPAGRVLVSTRLDQLGVLDFS